MNKTSLILKHPVPGMPEERIGIHGCIFDFDGVIVDTEHYHHAAWNHAAHLADTCLTWEEYLPLKSTARPHILDFIQSKAGKVLDSSLRQQIINAKVARFDILIQELSEKNVIPGVLDFIRRLSDDGIRLAIASSSTTARDIAREFRLSGYFDAIIDGNAPLPKKPAPDLFLAAAAALQCPPEQCLVFEDSLAGIDGAVNAGIPVVAVGGIRSPKAAAHIEDFQDIWTLFEPI